ncbi:MAG: hypothetical protein C4519_07160 [Desulfobacteraceae bacterium]|nr:MAG: hypothetical protein C4519_07160 [Desulfobacteraceae bacterium]
MVRPTIRRRRVAPAGITHRRILDARPAIIVTPMDGMAIAPMGIPSMDTNTIFHGTSPDIFISTGPTLVRGLF